MAYLAKFNGATIKADQIIITIFRDEETSEPIDFSLQYSNKLYNGSSVVEALNTMILWNSPVLLFI